MEANSCPKTLKQHYREIHMARYWYLLPTVMWMSHHRKGYFSTSIKIDDYYQQPWDTWVLSLGNCQLSHSDSRHQKVKDKLVISSCQVLSYIVMSYLLAKYFKLGGRKVKVILLAHHTTPSQPYGCQCNSHRNRKMNTIQDYYTIRQQSLTPSLLFYTFNEVK